VSESVVAAFVDSHRDWILKNQHRLQEKKQTFESPTTLTLFGKTYQKEVVIERDLPSQVNIEGSIITVKVHSATSSTLESKSRAVIKAFLMRTAESYIRPRVEDFARLMKTSYVSLRLKEQVTRWGSCSSQGNLNFNWRLVHMPPEIIDYVIVHELAHRTHMDHSARFWSLVAQFDPEWQKHRGWLKRNGLSVG
jgi:hypothetical protein